MRLTGSEFTELEGALADAYLDYDDLRGTLARTGRRLQDIAAPGRMSVVVTDLIQYAESEDWVHELVAAARSAKPRNERLLRVAAAMGLEPGGVPVGDLPPDEALPAVAARFERMVDVHRGIADLGSYAEKIQELLRQVCAVELGEESGTGFLIGPDTVLTNYHVVESAIGGGYPPGNIQLRFDYRRLRDGVTTNGGKVHVLADEWLVHAARYSSADTRRYDEARPPGEDELDYAVLRTKERVGEELSTGAGSATRGWIRPRRDAYDFPVDSFLMVIQHPCHDPLSFDAADDALIRLNANGTRVHYRTNTMPGSSGAPVLDRHLDLVALHHAGEPGSPDGWLPCRQQTAPASYNEGIPIALIESQLGSLGHGWVFGGDEP